MAANTDMQICLMTKWILPPFGCAAPQRVEWVCSSGYCSPFLPLDNKTSTHLSVSPPRAANFASLATVARQSVKVPP